MISSEIVTLLRLKNSKVQRSMLKKLISRVNYIIINYIELLRAPFHDEAILIITIENCLLHAITRVALKSFLSRILIADRYILYIVYLHFFARKIGVGSRETKKISR